MLQSTIGSGNAFDIIFEGENLNKPEGLNNLTERQIQDQNNPIIMKEIDTNLILRYNDFEEYQPGKWKTKKDNKKVKNKEIIKELNSII